MREVLNGIYSGTVRAVDDAEGRYRVLVQVDGVHRETVGNEGLNWAEMCSVTGKYCGDFFGYAPGDTVWVMFKGGREELPVVLGGRNDKRLGVMSTPISAQESYVDGIRRWTRIDRSGNMMEMSEIGDEQYVRMKSGAAEVKVSRIGNEVVVSSPGGTIRVEAGTVAVKSTHAAVTSSSIDIYSEASNPLTQLDNGKMRVVSNDRLDISAHGSIPGPSPQGGSLTGEVTTGGYATRFMGVPVGPGNPLIPLPLPKQAAKNSQRGRVINIGTGLSLPVPAPVYAPAVPVDPTGAEALVDYDGWDVGVPIPMPPTLAINIRSAGSIVINGNALTLQSTAPMTISALGMLNLTSTGMATITALAGLTVASSGPTTVTATTMTVNASGAVSLSCAGFLRIAALSVSIETGTVV